MMFRGFSISSACFLLIASTLNAEPLPVLNPSFEADSLSETGKQWQFNMKNWSGYRLGIMVPSEGNFADDAQIDGNQVAFLSFQDSWMAQDIEATLRPDTVYTLSVRVGLRQDSNFGQGGEYSLALMAGDSLLSETRFQTPMPGQFKTVTHVFSSEKAHSELGQPLRIKFSNISARQVNFDLVELSAADISEPVVDTGEPVWETVGLWTYDETDGLRLADGFVIKERSGAGFGQKWSRHIELSTHDTLPQRPRMLWPVSLNRKDHLVCVDAPYPTYEGFIDLEGDAHDGIYTFASCKPDTD